MESEFEFKIQQLTEILTESRPSSKGSVDNLRSTSYVHNYEGECCSNRDRDYRCDHEQERGSGKTHLLRRITPPRHIQPGPSATSSTTYKDFGYKPELSMVDQVESYLDDLPSSTPLIKQMLRYKSFYEIPKELIAASGSLPTSKTTFNISSELPSASNLSGEVYIGIDVLLNDTKSKLKNNDSTIGKASIIENVSNILEAGDNATHKESGDELRVDTQVVSQTDPRHILSSASQKELCSRNDSKEIPRTGPKHLNRVTEQKDMSCIGLNDVSLKETSCTDSQEVKHENKNQNKLAYKCITNRRKSICVDTNAKCVLTPAIFNSKSLHTRVSNLGNRSMSTFIPPTLPEVFNKPTMISKKVLSLPHVPHSIVTSTTPTLGNYPVEVLSHFKNTLDVQIRYNTFNPLMNDKVGRLKYDQKKSTLAPIMHDEYTQGSLSEQKNHSEESNEKTNNATINSPNHDKEIANEVEATKRNGNNGEKLGKNVKFNCLTRSRTRTRGRHGSISREGPYQRPKSPQNGKKETVRSKKRKVVDGHEEKEGTKKYKIFSKTQKKNTKTSKSKEDSNNQFVEIEIVSTSPVDLNKSLNVNRNIRRSNKIEKEKIEPQPPPQEIANQKVSIEGDKKTSVELASSELLKQSVSSIKKKDSENGRQQDNKENEDEVDGKRENENDEQVEKNFETTRLTRSKSHVRTRRGSISREALFLKLKSTQNKKKDIVKSGKIEKPRLQTCLTRSKLKATTKDGSNGGNMHDGQKIDSFIGIEYNDDHEKTEPTNLNPFSKSNISEVNLLNCNNAKVFQSEVQTTENSLEVFAPRKQDDPNLKNDNDPQQPSTNTDGDKKASPSIKIEDSSELSKLVEVNTNDNPENELTDSIKIFGTTCNSPSLPNKVTKSFDHSEFAFSVNTKNTAVRTEIEIIVLSDSNDDASEEIELNQSIVAQDKLNVSIKDEKSLNDTRSSSSGNNTETAEKISPSPLRQEILNQEISIQENKEKSFELASSEFSGQAATLSLLSSQLTASTIPPISAISPPSLLPYPLTQSHISLPSSSPPPLTAWLPSLHVLSPPSSSSPPSSFPSPPSPIDTDNPVNIDNLAVSDIDTSFDSISTELFGQAPALQHSISQTIASPLQTPQQISFSSSSPLPLSPSLPSLLTLASPPPPPMDTDNLLDSSHVLDEPDLDCIPMSAEQLSEIEFYSLNNAMTSESLELFHHDDFDDRVTVLLDNNVNNNNNNDATFNVPDNNDLETTKNINETNRNASNICESYDYGSNPFNGISSVSTNPSIINRVDNLGYSHNNDIVIYYCLVETCTSTFLCSDLSVRLKSHLTEEHAQICWKGYCHTCIAQVSCNRNLTLDNELQHIVDYHIKSKAIRLPKSATKKPEEKSNNIVDSPSTCSLNSDTTTADNQSQGSNVAGKALNDANKILHDQPKKIFTATPLSMPQQTQQTRPPLNKPFCLKPWTETKSKKSQQNSLKLLHRVCLFSLYKCMGDECAFTTNNAIIMTEHLKNHISQAEESGVLFHGYSSFLECAYCSAQSTTIHQLVSHITAVHSQDIYQCPYCFYRACCGYYIITHLQQFHPADVEYVLVCFGEKQVPNLIKICNSRRQFVKSIECFDCKEKFFILRNFENHIKTVHQKELSFTCALCSVLVHKNNALHHYSQIHNISKLQCVYCIFGGSTVDYMRKHMANMHSSALPYVTLREPDEDILLTDTELLDTATQIICIADTVDPNVFRSCPYYPRQLNLMSPTLKDATHTNDPVIQKSNDVQFTHIQSTINVQMPQTIISIKDVNLTGLSSVLPADTQFFPNTISSKSKVVPSSVSSTIVSSAIVQQPRNLNIGERTSIINKSTISMTQQETPTLQPEITILTSMCQTTETMINENPLTTKELYLKIEQAACEIVSGTGLVGHKLYRCGFSECSEQLPDIDKFSEHILCHLADTKIPINCYHCKVNFKTLIDFKIHLEIHSVHRYFCFWCKFTGSIVITLTQHISDSHSVNNVITYPLISGKDDENLHYFIIGPKSVEKEQMSGFYDKLLRLWKHKKSLMKIHYTPDEIDTLPQQDIFLKELFCSVCQYSTKVRRNIYQHLERHLAQVNITTNHVPDTDNINTSLSSIRNPLIEKSEPKNKTIWECSICRHRTDTDSQISAHMEQMHQIQHKYQCSNCPFTSAIIEDLVMHTSANHPNQVPEVRIKFYEVKDSPSLNDADETFRDNDFIIISDDDSASVVDLCEESATDNDIEILTEFQLEHDQTVIPTVVSENKSPSHVIDYKKAQLSLEQFNKYIKYICYYCPDVLYDDLKMVINHHETAHKTLNEHTALRFKIKKIFKCSLCLYTDIYQNVFQHYKAEHSGLPIITRDAFDDFKCGLCSLQTCDPGKLCEHYLSDHSETQRNENKEPTNYITDEFLNDLLFHTDGFGEEFFCEICLNIFKNMQVYSEHHKNKHGRKVKSWSKPCIRYACLICPAKIYINRPNILKHITCKHSLKYLGNQDKGLHATSISTNLDNDIDLIFPNGFTLKTCEAKFTKYYIWKKQASDENKRQSSRKSSSIKRYVGETSSSGNKKATGTTIKPVKKIPKK